MDGSYEMSESLIGVKSVMFALAVIQFFLICIVDKTVLQLSMFRDTTDARPSFDASESMNRIDDTQRLMVADQSQVLSCAI